MNESPAFLRAVRVRMASNSTTIPLLKTMLNDVPGNLSTARLKGELEYLEDVTMKEINTLVGGDGVRADPERVSIFMFVFNILLFAEWLVILILTAHLRPYNRLVRMCPLLEHCVKGFGERCTLATWVWARASRTAEHMLVWRVMRPIPYIIGVQASDLLPALVQASIAYNLAWPFLVYQNEHITTRVCDAVLRWQSALHLEFVAMTAFTGLVFLSCSVCICYLRRVIWPAGTAQPQSTNTAARAATYYRRAGPPVHAKA